MDSGPRGPFVERANPFKITAPSLPGSRADGNGADDATHRDFAAARSARREMLGQLDPWPRSRTQPEQRAKYSKLPSRPSCAVEQGCGQNPTRKSRGSRQGAMKLEQVACRRRKIHPRTARAGHAGPPFEWKHDPAAQSKVQVWMMDGLRPPPAPTTTPTAAELLPLVQ